MVNLCDTNYHLTYSESYSGLINSFALPIIADFPYVASLSAALNCLVMDNCHAFILTVDIYTAAIYCLPNGDIKFLILIAEIYLVRHTRMEHVL